MITDQEVPGSAGSGHFMLEVTIKAKAVAELLLLFKKQKQEQPRIGKIDVNENNYEKKVNNEVEDEMDTVTSELFIRCLQSFLCPPISDTTTSSSSILEEGTHVF